MCILIYIDVYACTVIIDYIHIDMCMASGKWLSQLFRNLEGERLEN